MHHRWGRRSTMLEISRGIPVWKNMFLPSNSRRPWWKGGRHIDGGRIFLLRIRLRYGKEILWFVYFSSEIEIRTTMVIRADSRMLWSYAFEVAKESNADATFLDESCSRFNKCCIHRSTWWLKARKACCSLIENMRVAVDAPSIRKWHGCAIR